MVWGGLVEGGEVHSLLWCSSLVWSTRLLRFASLMMRFVIIVTLVVVLFREVEDVRRRGSALKFLYFLSWGGECP